MILSENVYKALKWTVMILLPAFSTLYFTLASVWGWAYTEQIMATVAAVTTFLGVVIGVSTARYNKTI
jgi:hypothetical protein